MHFHEDLLIFLQIKSDRLLSNLHGDPRYRQLLVKLKLAD